jgi:formate--tetrahydrofolate ligase
MVALHALTGSLGAIRPIVELAREIGITEDALTLYGSWTGKVDLGWVGKLGARPRGGTLVLVTAITPSTSGEGKTVTAIGLGMALHRLGNKSVVCIRQPSLGPTFGLKGGAAGGGRCTVEPFHDINLHFTGDIDAIGSAHNLLSAMADNHIYQGNELGIDSGRLTWPRVVDMDDRALRRVIVGVGETRQGVQHESIFDITAASEVMAIHGLSRDYADLEKRLGRVMVGYTVGSEPVTAAQLRATGAMAVLLREAMAPNLVQTVEGTPALVHGGPFADIAHGTSSLVSTFLGLKLADYCVIESGFATDLGMEKFIDIVARTGGFDVNVAVLVVTVNTLRHHGNVPKDAIESPNARAVTIGLGNLAKHVENVRAFGLTPVVAINRFPTDSEEELRQVREFCKSCDVACADYTAFTQGSVGATELAKLVVDAAKRGERSHPIYSLDKTIKEKLDVIVREIYGGSGIEYVPAALEDMALISRLGLDGRPVCVAKTHLSLSDDQKKIGRPRGFVCKVERILPAAGAGFNIAYMGNITTLPGLPRAPLAEQMSLSEDGVISGLR